ncbi:MAG: TraR/DksA C4-type zinc finger protein [Planctomycetota bacterium]
MLSCTDCEWRENADAEQLANKLRLVGLLRRDKNPGDDIVAALLPEAVDRMTCPVCRCVGLVVGPAADHDDADDFDTWQAAALCKACRKPIPPERLEVFPDAKRCVDCQGKEERGETDDEPEFCPRCGSLVELRVSHAGGRTRYRRFCTGTPGCRL